MKFTIGEKQAMTHYFDADGASYPATRIVIGDVVVTQVKTEKTDGYNAVQVGFGAKQKKRIAQPQAGHYKDLGLFQGTKEFLVSEKELSDYTVGSTVDLSLFGPGDVVQVSGISKGKGFQGVVKRHGFAGGRRTHGQKHSEREGGSIGATGPQRVFKGKKMPGRMGGDRVTVKNLTILAVDAKKGELLVRGAVPGRRGSTIELVAKKS